MGRKAAKTPEQYFEAFAKMRDEGQKITLDGIVAELGGSKSTAAAMLKTWRDGQASAAREGKASPFVSRFVELLGEAEASIRDKAQRADKNKIAELEDLVTQLQKALDNETEKNEELAAKAGMERERYLQEKVLREAERRSSEAEKKDLRAKIDELQGFQVAAAKAEAAAHELRLRVEALEARSVPSGS